MADLDLGGLKSLNSELERMEAISGRTERRMGDLKARMREMRLAGKESTAEYANLASQLTVARDKMLRFSDSTRSLKNLRKTLKGMVPEKQIKNIKDYNKHLSDMNAAYDRQLRAAKASGTLTNKQYEKMIADVEAFKKMLADVSAEPIRISLEADSGDLDTRRAARRRQAEIAGGSARGLLGSFGDITGLKSKMMSGAGDAFQGVWEGGKKMQDSFKTLTTTLSAAGKGTGVFVGALKVLGDAFKTNPIGLIIGSIAALGSVVGELDKMIKGLNRAWREMAGSPVLMKNVRASMKEFNDSIFNLGRNMKLGLKSSDIQEFFKTMSTAGLSTEGVSKRVGSFNKAIEDGFKLSRQFGVSFSDMGSMMADQMLNLRSSIEDVSDAFKTMSYDAAVAGVQSQKFYQVIESASSSLSFYGNFLKSSSDMLRTFTETGVMGFKDASQTVQDLMGTIKGMSMEQRMAAINVLGQEKVYEMFTDRLNEMSKGVSKLENSIADMEARRSELPEAQRSDIDKEISAAKKRLAAAKLDHANLRQRAGKGDLAGMASMMESLSDKVLEMAADYLRNVNVDPFEDVLATQKVLRQQFNMSEDTISRVMKKGTGLFDMFEGDWVQFYDVLNDPAKRKTMQGLANAMHQFFTDPSSSSFLSMEHMMRAMRASAVKLGISETSAEMDDLMQVMAESGPFFKDYVKTLTDATMGEKEREMALKDIALKAGMFTAPGKPSEIRDKQLEELVQQTTPLADYLEIGKEGVKYALASSNLQQTMTLGITKTAHGVGKILGLLLSKFRREGGSKVREQEALLEGAEGRRYKGLYGRRGVLTEMLGKRREGGASDTELRAIEVAIAETTEGIKAFEKTYENVPHAFADLRASAMLNYDELSDQMRKNLAVVEEGTKKHKEYEAALRDEGLTAEKRANLLEKDMQLVDELNNATQEYNQALELLDVPISNIAGDMGLLRRQFGRTMVMDSSLNRMRGATQWGSEGDIPVPAQTGVASQKQQGDFFARTGGMVRVSKGDYVIDSASLARGIGMGRGQLMNQGAGIMKGSGLSIGNVQLNFNAPVNGDPEEYRRMFIAAVNDVVNKRMYEEKSRV